MSAYHPRRYVVKYFAKFANGEREVEEIFQGPGAAKLTARRKGELAQAGKSCTVITQEYRDNRWQILELENPFT